MWPCFNCQFESSTSTDWLDHLAECHQQKLFGSLASAAIATACRKIVKPVEEEKCLLCDKYPSSTRRALIAHIGKHMEEVAMMALPKDHMNDSDYSSESDDGNTDIDDMSEAGRKFHTENFDRVMRKLPSPLVSFIGETGSGKRALMNTVKMMSESKNTRPVIMYPRCASSFDNEQDLDAHMDAHMTTPTIGHKCPYCSESFASQSVLKKHLLNHSPENPYCCETCRTRFSRLHDLKNHAQVHTWEKPYPCPTCDRVFFRADSLALHIRSGCAGRRPPMKNSDFESDTVIDSGTQEILSKPRCQRCKNSKKGCDRQRPCQRCKDNDIGPEGCISEGEGSGMNDQPRSHRDVSVKGDSSFSDIADTSSNNGERMQDQKPRAQSLTT